MSVGGRQRETRDAAPHAAARLEQKWKNLKLPLSTVSRKFAAQKKTIQINAVVLNVTNFAPQHDSYTYKREMLGFVARVAESVSLGKLMSRPVPTFSDSQ